MEGDPQPHPPPELRSAVPRSSWRHRRRPRRPPPSRPKPSRPKPSRPKPNRHRPSSPGQRPHPAPRRLPAHPRPNHLRHPRALHAMRRHPRPRHPQPGRPRRRQPGRRRLRPRPSRPRHPRRPRGPRHPRHPRSPRRPRRLERPQCRRPRVRYSRGPARPRPGQDSLRDRFSRPRRRGWHRTTWFVRRATRGRRSRETARRPCSQPNSRNPLRSHHFDLLADPDDLADDHYRRRTNPSRGNAFRHRVKCGGNRSLGGKSTVLHHYHGSFW